MPKVQTKLYKVSVSTQHNSDTLVIEATTPAEAKENLKKVLDSNVYLKTTLNDGVTQAIVLSANVKIGKAVLYTP
jgi:hypothetical protein